MMFGFIESVPAAVIRDWILCAGGALWAAVMIRNLVRGPQPRSITPQPLQVQGVDRFVEKSTFDRALQKNDEEHKQIFAKINGSDRGVHQQFEAVRKEMHEMELRITSCGEERTTKVHDRVNQVLEAVSELRGEIKRSRQL
jgi:hypothetical protein